MRLRLLSFFLFYRHGISTHVKPTTLTYWRNLAQNTIRQFRFTSGKIMQTTCHLTVTYTITGHWQHTSPWLKHVLFVQRAPRSKTSQTRRCPENDNDSKQWHSSTVQPKLHTSNLAYLSPGLYRKHVNGALTRSIRQNLRSFQVLLVVLLITFLKAGD